MKLLFALFLFIFCLTSKIYCQDYYNIVGHTNWDADVSKTKKYPGSLIFDYLKINVNNNIEFKYKNKNDTQNIKWNANKVKNYADGTFSYELINGNTLDSHNLMIMLTFKKDSNILIGVFCQLSTDGGIVYSMLYPQIYVEK